MAQPGGCCGSGVETHRAIVRKDQRDDGPKRRATQCRRDGRRTQPRSAGMGRLLLTGTLHQSLPVDQRARCVPVRKVVACQTQRRPSGRPLAMEPLAPAAIRAVGVEVESAPPAASKRMNLLREPDAGNPHVRFDERDVETEHNQVPPRHVSTLPLRHSSTLGRVRTRSSLGEGIPMISPANPPPVPGHHRAIARRCGGGHVPTHVRSTNARI